MKKVLIVMLFLSFSSAIISQHVVVTCDKNNDLYIGVDNPISVAVENYPSSQITVKADHGTLEGSGWRYFYRGTEPGVVRITAYNKSNLEKIGSWVFRLRYIPNPVAKVGPWGNDMGNARAVVLQSQNWIRADLEYFDYEATFRIDSFTLSILYRDSCFSKKVLNAGNNFNDEVKAALKTIKNGDIVIFEKISVIGPDRRRRLISPLILTITD